jgi:hypothetical protein
MYNVYGVICMTYNEACEVAGIETPEQAAAEDRYWAAEESIEEQDRLEACGPTFGRFFDFDNWNLPF